MCRKKEEGSETKQEVISLKSAWRQWIAKLSNAIMLGLFNFPLIFQTMVSYWVGKGKGTFKYDPCAVCRMEGGNPKLDASSLGKERFLLLWPSGSPAMLPISSTVHPSPSRCISLWQGRLATVSQTALTALGPLQAAKNLHFQVHFTSQGPLLKSCTPDFSVTLCNGILPRIASITLSNFMPCICKLLWLPFIFMVLLLNMWAFEWD